MPYFLIAYIGLLACLTPTPSFAYLVPLLGGAGAILALLGVIFALLASVGFTLWYHTRNVFRKMRGTPPINKDAAPDKKKKSSKKNG